MKNSYVSVKLLLSSLMVFLCITKAAASEEMGCCSFQAPDAAFATAYDKQALAENHETACSESKSCLFTWVLHPSNYLITNIGDDHDKIKSIYDPFKEERKIGAYTIHLPENYVYTPGKKSRVLDGWVRLNGNDKLIKMECRVSLVKKQPNVSIVKDDEDSSGNELLDNLGKFPDICQWK